MKNLFFLMLFTFGIIMIVNAQPTPPTPPATPGVSTSHSTTRNHVKINMNLDNKQKLKLNSTDNRFSMVIDFKKVDHGALRKLLMEYLDQPTISGGDYDQWIGSEKEFKYLLKKNKLKVTINKTNLSSKELDNLFQLTTETFATLGWEVDLKQL